MPFKPTDKNKWPKPKICLSPEHNPPGHIVLEPGMHTWVCPECGKETTYEVPPVIC